MTILAQEKLLVTRDSGGSYSGGEYSPSLQAPFSIRANVQPMSPEMAQLLPESARTSGKWVVYAAARQPEIKTVDLVNGSQADRIRYRGRDYVALSVADWSAHRAGIPHRAYVLTAIGEDE